MRPTLRQAICLQAPVILVACGLIVVPAIVLLIAAFSAMPPYNVQLGTWTIDNVKSVLEDAGYRSNALTSVLIGLRSALLATVGGLVLGYWIVFRARRRNLWLLLLMISFIPSYVVRIYAWRSLLGSDGVVADVLSAVGLAADHEPVLIFTSWAVVLAQVQIFLPFCALVIAAALTKIDPALIDQARNLGYGWSSAMWHGVLPLAGRAILGSMVFTFFFCTGDYLTPELLGGQSGVTLGYVIAQLLQVSGDYAGGAALSFLMLVLFVVFFVVARVVMRAAGLLPRL